MSRDLEPIFGASDARVPLTEVLEVADAAIGVATGFALPDIPMLPVRESNNPPTEGDALATTSGSVISPVTMSPIVCTTINALSSEKRKRILNTQET